MNVSKEKFKEDRISNYIPVYLEDFADDFNLRYHLCVEVIILLLREYVKNVLFHESRWNLLFKKRNASKQNMDIFYVICTFIVKGI